MSDYYIILINEDHSFTHTNKQRIMYRSNNIQTIQFLVNQTYNDLDMTTANAVLEYRTPISHKYSTIVLSPSDELYKNKVEFLLPIDTTFTSEIGNLEFTINFSYLAMDDDGNFTEMVRTIGSTSILIEDTPRWSDYIASSDLDNIAQIMLTNQSLLEQMETYAEMIAYSKADGIAKDEKTNEIYLTSDGIKLGEGVIDSDTCAYDEDGVPVIDFGHSTDDSGDSDDSGSNSDDNSEFSDVVEF